MLQFCFEKVPLGYFFFLNKREFGRCLRNRNLINRMQLYNDTLKWPKHSVLYLLLKDSRDHLSKNLQNLNNKY